MSAKGALRTAPSPLQRWAAHDYAKNASFVPELARGLIDVLAPQRGMRILDLGCGDGVLTAEIAARGADVVGVDASEDMVAAARARDLEALVMNAHALRFDREFDAEFSNAALHWMPRQDLVIAGVAHALKPGGRFVAEFGGHGNVAAIATALRAMALKHGLDAAKAAPWTFPSAAAYCTLLEEGGFEVEDIVLLPRPTILPTDMAGWLTTFARTFFE